MAQYYLYAPCWGTRRGAWRANWRSRAGHLGTEGYGIAGFVWGVAVADMFTDLRKMDNGQKNKLLICIDLTCPFMDLAHTHRTYRTRPRLFPNCREQDFSRFNKETTRER